MTVGLEREKKVVSGEVKKIPDEVEVSEKIQKAGVESTQTQIPDHIEIQKGKGVVISSEGDRASTVKVPAESEDKLESLSKGSPDFSITWFARFWLRMWKKARHLGRKIVRMPVKNSI